MRYAVISDIHSNREALSRALDLIDGMQVDEIVCLGDIVGYGANPSECLALVRERTSLITLGNHDHAVNDPKAKYDFNTFARSAIRWTVAKMTIEEKSILRSLPFSISLDQFHFVHATPHQPEQWDYIFSAFEARLYERAFHERVCFVGHSHVPGIYSMNPKVLSYNSTGRFIINVGSIGQPRDGDPRLSYGIVDTVAGTYENFRLEYDVETAAAKILDAGLPKSLAERLFIGR